MKNYNISILLMLVIIISSCIKEDHFGYSSFGEIKSIQISNQSGNASINSNDKTVAVNIPAGVSLQNLRVNELSLSSFAITTIEEGSEIDLREPLTITIISEDESSTNWTITANVATDDPQLANNDFEYWYQVNAGYYEPGLDESSTIWGSANAGGSMLDKIATTPFEITTGNLVAKLETLDNGFLGNLVGAPITTATIFTGKFHTDRIVLDNPRVAVELGVPFTGRPKAFTFQYQYEPGPVYKDRGGNVLEYGDQCDIYMFLEVREGDVSKRLATGLFRSGEVVDEMTQIRVDLIYGELDASFPEEHLPEDGFVSEELVEFILPTHISFLATSGFEGDLFKGAIGSTLLLDDLELIYE